MSNEIRALLIAPYFFPRNHGGAAQLYDGLIRRFRGLRVTVLSERQGVSTDDVETFDREALTNRGYEVRRMRRMTFRFRSAAPLRNLADGALFFAAAQLSFRNCLRQARPDVVICGGVYAAGWLFNTVPRRVASVNYVLGEEITQGITGGLWSRYLRRQQRRALRRADANIALSRFTADAVAALIGNPAPPVHLLTGCVDTDRFKLMPDRENERSRLGWTDRTVLLTVARLVPRKGIDRVLHALALLRSQGRLRLDWLYVVSGRGPEEARLRSLTAELHLDKQVHFTGFVSDEELSHVYNAADVFVLANRDIAGDTEGFGLVFLEANACGLPVIGGTAGGTADAIQEGVSGVRVDVESIGDLADAIGLLMRDSQRRQALSLAGLERVRSQFSMSASASVFEELLAALVQSKTSRSLTER